MITTPGHRGPGQPGSDSLNAEMTRPTWRMAGEWGESPGVVWFAMVISNGWLSGDWCRGWWSGSAPKTFEREPGQLRHKPASMAVDVAPHFQPSRKLSTMQ